MNFKGHIHTKEGIKEALRRNKMQSKRTLGLPTSEIKSRGEFSEFLEVYVFQQLNMTPNELLRSLEHQYYAKQNFRDRRERNIDFTRGRQLGEPVYDPDIKRITTQWEYNRRRGISHMTYNIVSKLQRSWVGQFREVNTGNIVKCESKDVRGQELASVLTECVNRVKNKNKSKSKDAKNMKEMLASGMPVFKVLWGSKDNMEKNDIKFRVVNTSKFNINPGVTDDDFANLYRGCEIHDTDLSSIVELFANGDYERGLMIKEEYIKFQGNEQIMSSYSSQDYDGSKLRNDTFYTQGTGNSSYRYYEVWNKISDYEASTYDPLELPGNDFKVYKWQNPKDVKKEIDALNEERLLNSEGEVAPEDILIQFSTNFRSRWYVTYLSPWGYVLDVRESPYKNGVMPYVMQSPDINGEIFGLIEEVLDAQLGMDKQIRQASSIIDNASKGVWLIPSDAVPDDMENKEYISQIKKTDGAVIVQMRAGQDAKEVMPQQVYANASNVGNQVQQMVQLYSNLVDEISGNYGAAQGKGTSSSTTATGYALESQNAGMNIRDTFENYFDVLLSRDELILRFVEEGYTKEDFFKITGEEIDPAEFDKYEFNMEQSKGTNSPAHRLSLEQDLLQQVYAGLLPYEVFLDISDNPVMIQAKQKLKEFNKQQAMNGQEPVMGAGGDVSQNNPAQSTIQSPGVDAGKIADNQMQKVKGIA